MVSSARHHRQLSDNLPRRASFIVSTLSASAVVSRMGREALCLLPHFFAPSISVVFRQDRYCLSKIAFTTKATLHADERGIQVSRNHVPERAVINIRLLFSRALSEAITRFISGVRFVMACLLRA